MDSPSLSSAFLVTVYLASITRESGILQRSLELVAVALDSDVLYYCMYILMPASLSR